MTALCALSDARDYALVVGNTDDATLARLIDAVSAAIESWTGCDFGPVSQRVQSFRGRNTDTVFLNQPGVTGIVSVLIDGRPVPAAAVGGHGWRLDGRTVFLRGYAFPRDAECVVTYNAGFAAVPDAVRQACIETVALRFREMSRLGEASRSVDGQTVSFITSELTPSAKGLLAPWVQVGRS